MRTRTKKQPSSKPKRQTALVLRTCDADMRSYGGFQWPKKGKVSAPDWAPTKSCGSGLHGFLWGEGDGSLASFAADAHWLVLEVFVDEIIDLGGKIKFPHCIVKHCGNQKSATEFLAANGGAGKAIVGGTSTSGCGGTSTSGYGGTSTSGYGGTSTSGDRGTSTSGDRGTSTSGDRGTSTSGDRGTSTSGDGGTSTSGDGGTSTSGDRGTSTSGCGGTSTSGDRGTSTSGDGGTSTSGDGGTISIQYWDTKAERYRTAIGNVGEDGIDPNTAYILDDAHRFIKKAVP